MLFQEILKMKKHKRSLLVGKNKRSLLVASERSIITYIKGSGGMLPQKIFEKERAKYHFW